MDTQLKELETLWLKMPEWAKVKMLRIARISIKPERLFLLGHACSPGKSYMFRLPISEDGPFVGDFVTAVKAVRNELHDAGVSRETIQKVELRIGGLFIEIKGEEEVIAEIERIHKKFLEGYE